MYEQVHGKEGRRLRSEGGCGVTKSRQNRRCIPLESVAFGEQFLRTGDVSGSGRGGELERRCGGFRRWGCGVEIVGMLHGRTFQR
jgi:hypothetical protein